MRWIVRIAIGVVFTLAVAWGAAALWIDGPTARPLAAALAGGWMLLVVGFLAVVRPAGRALMAVAVAFGVLGLWWNGIEPRNDRDWLPDVANLPRAEFDGDLVTIHNVRNFDYRSETDYTPRWETRTYDLSRLRGFDMFTSSWGAPLILHTIASWEFDDGRHLAISIETRKEVGEAYSAVLGFFRQFELYYVVADERDVIGLRAKHRGERLHLFRLRTDPAHARGLLRSYLETVTALTRQPRWYNAATQNCTTTIRLHAKQAAASGPWNWRLLVNGYGDELLYMRGMIDTSRPLEELRRLSDVTERARNAPDDERFAEAIRVDLPPRPAPLTRSSTSTAASARSVP